MRLNKLEKALSKIIPAIKDLQHHIEGRSSLDKNIQLEPGATL